MAKEQYDHSHFSDTGERVDVYKKQNEQVLSAEKVLKKITDSDWNNLRLGHAGGSHPIFSCFMEKPTAEGLVRHYNEMWSRYYEFPIFLNLIKREKKYKKKAEVEELRGKFEDAFKNL